MAIINVLRVDLRCLLYQLGARERPVAKKKRGEQTRHDGGPRREQNERYVCPVDLWHVPCFVNIYQPVFIYIGCILVHGFLIFLIDVFVTCK
jgi:hypothetical protein